MVNRHVVTKQRAPSTKSMIARIEVKLAMELTPEDRSYYEYALDFWRKPKKERAKL